MEDGCGAQLTQRVEAVKPPRFQKQEPPVDPLKKVRLVLNEQDGLAGRPEAGDAFENVFAVFGTDAGRWFVEKKQAGIQCDAAGQSEEFLLPVGNVGRRMVGNFGKKIVG